MRLPARFRLCSGLSPCATVRGLPRRSRRSCTVSRSLPPRIIRRKIEVDVPRGCPPGTLEARMSRSSPGRYAAHDFAKNVFEVKASDGKGRRCAAPRPNPYSGTSLGHDGTVRIAYKIYGDHVDGTYLAVDASHAHMNMPATLMWARGLDMRPARVAFEPPQGLGRGRWRRSSSRRTIR